MDIPENGAETTKKVPGLLGLERANRDFSLEANWGKNQFNSAFPAALGIYMHGKKFDPVYIKLDLAGQVKQSTISVKDLYGADPVKPEVFFAFEEAYAPYETFVTRGKLPRVDLVVMKKVTGGKMDFCRPLEIKLTALPDEITSAGPESNYGSELVVRPDTIVYLAILIAKKYVSDSQKEGLKLLLDPVCGKKTRWERAENVIPRLPGMYACLDQILEQNTELQEPILMQPVWKTQGTTSKLHDDCLDMFVWSDFALTKLFLGVARGGGSRNKITRHRRAVIWLVKMLHAFSRGERMNIKEIIDKLTYKTKNDKAFSVSGEITRDYMRSPQLTSPRVGKSEIKNIILNGGEKMLRPERRFDSAITNTPGLF